jgi:glycolate oxidase FAD binding subunit
MNLHVEVPASVNKPTSIAEVQQFVRKSARLQVRGGGTKTALSRRRPEWDALELTELSGILEYEPSEFTFTALAGTRLAEVDRVLAGYGQYLPFDPLWAGRGATLGGAVAANTSGPGRYHYGGVRDFVIGVRLVDGDGHLVRGGGKVVKNAAGFDLPKLMVGSLGALGVMVELSFKVFPQAPAFATLEAVYPEIGPALEAMQRAANSRLDLDALDIQPGWSAQGDPQVTLWVRLGGLAEALERRLARLCAVVGDCRVLRGAEDAELWQQAREMAWAPARRSLVRVPLTPGRITEMENWLNSPSSLLPGELPVLRRYLAGGQAAWLAVEGPLKTLDGYLGERGLTGLALLGEPQPVRLGLKGGLGFYQRVKHALDPAGRFVEV